MAEANGAQNGNGNGNAAPKEVTVKTEHRITIGGQLIEYTATAGTYIFHEEDKEKSGERAAKATMFYVAYTRKDGDASTRPVTFAFNGGPGSSSVWLHLGILGPRRVEMDEMGNPPPPPTRLVDNEFSLLDVTDLVFIDPVSTGYSRPAEGEKADQFHGFKKDLETVGEFIRLWATRNGRWASPKFLAGESYGTTRAAGLSGYLQNNCGIYLNGIMLISSILNFQTADFDHGNDLPYILFLPTYTATAWYHGRLDGSFGSLRAALDQAEAFAGGDYAAALFRGNRLPQRRRKEIVDRLAALTGLTTTFVEQCDLRVDIFRFVKELLRSEGRTVGRLDSRFKGIDRDAAGENFSYDPSYSTIQGPYTAALNDYVRRALNYESDLPYEILTGKVQPWNYEPFRNRYVEVGETLRDAISRNPALKVLVANGYYDLATPYFATEYTFNHLGLDSTLQPNIRMRYYEAGHMMYIHHPSLVQLKADLAEFVQAAL